jgi:DNA-binding transcriptional ArsR family regulator
MVSRDYTNAGAQGPSGGARGRDEAEGGLVLARTLRCEKVLVNALTGIFGEGHIQAVIETLAALAEPNRFRIVELLRTGPRSVNDIGDRLHLNQPQVSKHLRVLKEAGLVDVEARAQQRVYELRPQPLRRLHGWLERYRRTWEERFEELDELVEEMKEKEKTHERKSRK